FILPVLLDGLEEHERIPRPVAQLVLGQIRGDRIDPGRELSGPVEPVEVSVYPNEDLLHEILSALPVSNGAVDEVQQPSLVALDQFLECALFAVQKGGDQIRIIQGV